MTKQQHHRNTEVMRRLIAIRDSVKDSDVVKKLQYLIDNL